MVRSEAHFIAKNVLAKWAVTLNSMKLCQSPLPRRNEPLVVAVSLLFVYPCLKLRGKCFSCIANPYMLLLLLLLSRFSRVRLCATP